MSSSATKKVVTLEITEANIKTAQRKAKKLGSHYDACPIRTALKRKGFATVGAAIGEIDVTTKKGVRLTATTTKKLDKFIKAFDTDSTLKPTKFTIRLSA